MERYWGLLEEELVPKACFLPGLNKKYMYDRLLLLLRRFQLRTDVTRGSQVDNNLRRMLSHCKDVVIKYRLAHDLGLSDVTKELLTADNGLLGAIVRDSNTSAGQHRQKS